MPYRRLVRDYEQRLDVSEAMMRVAVGPSLMHVSGNFLTVS
jgi:hypothetical protein